jgi:hypothetical protein
MACHIVRTCTPGDNTMLTRIVFGLAVILSTASAALAATGTPSIESTQNVYNPRGAYAGSDPDPAVRFELRRDWGRGQAHGRPSGRPLNLARPKTVKAAIQQLIGQYGPPAVAIQVGGQLAEIVGSGEMKPRTSHVRLHRKPTSRSRLVGREAPEAEVTQSL